MTDSIIEELYAIKEAIAREANYDSERMSASAQQCIMDLERRGYKFKYLPLPSSCPKKSAARPRSKFSLKPKTARVAA